ncbi:hydroxypyruvate reductase [Chitinophaga dinghuensis]|uniref:Hydroxypyruvate reductase n=1 Tax=Chitinophaga dinghuensis TaxID=1539050 RepID=A0A327WHZ3_9BACT|nr:glycerate kinase [Chitinophaga dinghuensis]RAJ87354.1 hydroxypyruvate reductase [Chitinophaga dinghuensis]
MAFLLKTMNTFHDIQEIFQAAVAAVQPGIFIPKTVEFRGDTIYIAGTPFPVHGKVIVIGAGKAAAAMAQELEAILLPHVLLQGTVVTKYHHSLPLQQLQLIEAGHPVPDANSVLATQQILAAVNNLQPHDLVIFLLSGGASSLLADVPAGCTLEEIQELFQLLLHSGAAISEMNTIRKHLSAVKGGQLAKHIYPATLCSIILSDVPGDQLEVIGSGPGVPDPTTFEDTMAILNKYHLTHKIPATILTHIRKGCSGEVPETAKAGDPAFINVHNFLTGTNTIALEAAAAKAKTLGYAVMLSKECATGEARTTGRQLIQKALTYDQHRPACLLQGGETTVTIRGKGKGGRNQELALAAVLELEQAGEKAAHITLLSAGTDGTDGPTDAAGAIADAYTLQRTQSLQLNTAAYLDNNDAYHFFKQTDRLFITGPTHTNVMDIQIVLIT